MRVVMRLLPSMVVWSLPQIFFFSPYLQMNVPQSCHFICILFYPRSVSPIPLRLFFFLSFGTVEGWVGGRGCRIEYVALLVDRIPCPSPKTYSTSYSRKKTGKWKSGITLQLDLGYPLFENIFVFSFILWWRAVWRWTSSLIRFLPVVSRLCKNTIFLKGHLSQHQCQNESV